MVRCKWCNVEIREPKRSQKFCCENHRYLWHGNQTITPGQLEERVRKIVRDEITQTRGLPVKGEYKYHGIQKVG